MKRSDLLGVVIYAIMLVGGGVAIFSVIRPILSNSTYSSALPINGVVLALLSLLGGVVITALTIELGHLAGAKLGRYEVRSWNCLYLQWSKKPDAKKGKFKLSTYDGLTGETKVVPQDIKKSNPRHMIYLPLVFFLVEVVVYVVLIAVFKTASAGNPSLIWVYIMTVIFLIIGCMIYFYDIFPATLDSKNDGRLLTILTNQTNVEAYNRILINDDLVSRGLPVEDEFIYQEVTNFTVTNNNAIVYDALSKGDIEKALGILELTIASKKTVSGSVYHDAIAMKTAIILLNRPHDEAKEYYIDLPLEEKKYINELNNNVSRAAYTLVSGLIEDSLVETQAALKNNEVGEKRLKNKPLNAKEQILVDAVQKVYVRHPDWDFTPYGFPKENPEAAEEKSEQSSEQ